MQSHVSKSLVGISTCQFSHKLITHEISYSHLPIHAVKSIINGPKSAHHIDNKDISTPSLRCYRIHEGCIRVFIIIIYTTRHHNSQTAFYNQSFNLFCAKWTKLYGFSFWNLLVGNNHHMSIHLIVRSVSDTFVSEGKYQISHKNSQNVLLYKRQSKVKNKRVAIFYPSAYYSSTRFSGMTFNVNVNYICDP